MFAHGTTFTVGGDAVGGLTNISLPEQTKGEVDLTDHDSGGDVEFVGGLRDNGSVTLEGTNIPTDTGQQALRTNYEADSDVVACVIELPDGTTTGTQYSFDGVVTGLGGENPYDDKATFTATIRVSGAVTVTPAA
ncbi:MAG TPA: phage tail tube protein [Longimicrobiales bacterium]|nr:phage tail tube protein [Longimicrobiales bacterium]